MKENISAFLDGEANELERVRVLRALTSDPELRATWDRYHLASTVIRRELETMLSPGVAARIQEQLRDEVPASNGVRDFFQSRAIKLGAGAAIAASAAAVALLNLPPVLGPAAEYIAKRAPGISTVADSRRARPEQLNALNPYLIQHGEFTPAAGMNGMLSYVRVVGRNSALESAPAPKSPVTDNATAE